MREPKTGDAERRKWPTEAGAEMDEFINDVFAVAGGTILSYSGSDISLSVPEKLGGADIVCIGNGAFMDSAKMRQVFIPYGVKQIGSEAFSGACTRRKLRFRSVLPRRV